jgi:hypothetical protein
MSYQVHDHSTGQTHLLDDLAEIRALFSPEVADEVEGLIGAVTRGEPFEAFEAFLNVQVVIA